MAVVGVRFVCHSKRWNVGTYRRSTEYTLEKTSNNQIDFREMTKQISKRMEKFRIFSLIICHGYVKMYNLRHKYRHKHQCLFICISISNGASEQSETMFIRSHWIASVSKSNIGTVRILEVYSSEAEVLKQDSHMNDFIMYENPCMILAYTSITAIFFAPQTKVYRQPTKRQHKKIAGSLIEKRLLCCLCVCVCNILHHFRS